MTPPIRAKLAGIIEVIEMASSINEAYLDRDTGRVTIITEDDRAYARSGEPDDAPKWQRDSLELVRLIDTDAGERFIPLPNSFDIHECR